MFFTLRRHCSLTGSLGSQKWFFHWHYYETPFGSFMFKSIPGKQMLFFFLREREKKNLQFMCLLCQRLFDVTNKKALFLLWHMFRQSSWNWRSSTKDTDISFVLWQNVFHYEMQHNRVLCFGLCILMMYIAHCNVIFLRVYANGTLLSQ